MNLNPQIQRYFKLSVALAVLAAAAVALNLFFGFKTRSASREFTRRNEELNALTAKKINLLQYQREGQKMEAIQERVQGSFVTKDRAVDFIVFLENAARDAASAVKIAAITEEAGQPKNFRLELAGSYLGLVSFLASLENSPYLARPTRIDINQTLDASRQTVLRTMIDLEVLSL